MKPFEGTRRRAILAGVAVTAGLCGVARAQPMLFPTQSEREAGTALIIADFAMFGDVRFEARDEAASDNGRAATETVPMPPPSILEARPDTVAMPRFEAASAYAPAQPDPTAAVDRSLRGTVEPIRPSPTAGQIVRSAIVVPLPRHRPAYMPVAASTMPLPRPGEVQVADLGGDGIGVPPPGHSGAQMAAIKAPITGKPRRIPKEALPYLSILEREAAANKVPLWLAVGVGWVESRYSPSLRGAHGVVGIMQVMPSTARFQGYAGPPERLIEPETNIVWGLRELGWAWRSSGGDVCLTLAKYKGGIATKTVSSAAASYCDAAKRVTGMI